MPAFQRKDTPLVCRGMNLNRPADQISPDQYQYLQNIRSYQEGRIEGRTGLTSLAPNLTPTGVTDYIHSGYTLFQENLRYIGYNTGLYTIPLVLTPTTATSIDTGFSGNPLSMIAASPRSNPQTWLYVYDSNRQRRYSSDHLIGGVSGSFPIGIPMPWGTLPASYTIGSGVLTGTYFYRIQVRDPLTGVMAQPSPPSGVPADPTSGGNASSYGYLTLSSNNAAFTMPTLNDPAGNHYIGDIYRWGGTVYSWKLVGSAPLDGTTVFTDNTPDINIQLGGSLDDSRFQPFVLEDVDHAGVVNTTAVVAGSGVGDGHGSYLNWVSGDHFNSNWLPGTSILVNLNKTATLRRWISTTQIEVSENLGVLTGASFNIYGPLLMGQPLPRVWGPYGSGQFGLFFFGVGAPNQPGTVFWTIGNDPDSSSPVNSLELTDPSEPLLNGCVWNGRVYVFSTERMWELVPDLSSGTFIAQVIPGGRGLVATWGLEWRSDAIYFIGKDGIYATTGGAPVSITDNDLLPLFSHDGVPGQQFTFANPDDPAHNIIINPPDPSFYATWRLTYGDGYLYFDYRESYTGLNKALVFCKFATSNGPVHGWVRDSYHQSGYTFRYWEVDFHNLLVGIGSILYLWSGVDDAGSPISCQVMTRAEDLGDERGQKLLGDGYFDCKPNGDLINLALLGQTNTILLTPLIPATASGGARGTTILDMDAGLGVLDRTVGLWASWNNSPGGAELYQWSPSWVPKPAITVLRATDWTDDNEPRNKYLYGCIIECNTYGQDRQIEIHGDNDQVLGVLTVNHSGQSSKPYFFTPLITHQMRAVPTDPATWELFRIIWYWNVKPEYTQWEGDWEDGGYNGAKFIQGLRLRGDTANLPISFSVLYDGGTVAGTFTQVVHNGETIYAYTFPTPFIAHLMKFIPGGLMRWTDPWKIEWIYEPAPDLAKNWITQFTTHSFRGYFSHRDSYIALQSYDDVIFKITLQNGISAQYIIASTAGAYKKIYEVLAALKDKAASYSLTSCVPFRLYRKDSEVRVKEWGTDSQYAVVRPFGDESFQTGAKI